MPQQPNLLFVSYSHNDEEFVQRVKVHLTPLLDWGQVDLWVDNEKIASGDFWKEKIDAALVDMKVGVVLVSADYLASEFIKRTEIPAFLRAAEGGAKIFALILKPSLFEQTELAKLQTVNKPDQPLIGVSEDERERAFVKLAQEIMMAITRRQRKSPTGAVNVDDTRAKLDFAIQNLLSTYEKYFLMALGSDTTVFEFQDSFRDKDHLRRLRDLEFIEKIGDKDIGKLRHSDNLKQLFRVTDKGRTYLRYLEESA